jgi:RHH-type proline utilization regulon transcriptional repressor/proline dehydrogenase/delta 1-pyrroline-5-carboxylate dehydrogenase
MDQVIFEERIAEKGAKFFAQIGSEKSSIFSLRTWIEMMMTWSMEHEEFKFKLFGFVDTIPELTTEKMLYDYIQEHFLNAKEIPGLFRFGLRMAGWLGKPGRMIVNMGVHIGLKTVAKQFIIGSNADKTVARLKKLREKQGYAFTLDVLGEETKSEKDADDYVGGYLELLASLKKALPGWKALGDGGSDMDWDSDPKVNISVKPSALCPKVEQLGFDEIVEYMLAKIKPMYRQIVEIGGYLCIDIETLRLREITFELYRRLRSDEEFRHHRHLGLAMQVYFTDYDEKLDEMLAWARSESLPISIRLVKGAYWDYEAALAKKNNEPSRVYMIKAESDIAFERAGEKILRNSDICHLACASHNVRSVIALMEMAKMLGVEDDRLEIQVLFGMAEAFRKAVLDMTPRVRLYCPNGELLKGMAYLVRRLIENGSNESFLQMTLAEGADVDRLMENPIKTLERENKET